MCCQRAREHNSFEKPPEYRFQSRTLDDTSQSSISRYLRSAPIPSSSVTKHSQKRKADLDLVIDAEEPQDLLSRLERQDAEYDREHGITEALEMPIRQRGGSPSAALAVRRASMAGPLQSERCSTADLLARARSSLSGEAAPRMPLLDRASRDAGPSTSSPMPPKTFGAGEGTPKPMAERPPQRRFLKALSPPQWLNNRDPST